MSKRRKSKSRISGGMFSFLSRNKKPKRKALSRRAAKKSRFHYSKWWKWALVPLALMIVGVVYLDFVVRDKFEGKKWSLAARVYARPLELYAGLTLSKSELEQELRELGYQFTAGANQPGQASLSAFPALGSSAGNSQGNVISLYSRGFSFWDKDEPALQLSVIFNGDVITELNDASGQPLAIVRLEPQEIAGIYPNQREDRLLVRLQDIPRILGETLIAVEDKHFREHHGVSPRGIARAFLANVRSGGVVQGGSTLTQQLVKNFYLNQDRSISRKVVEAIMAISLDAHYSKGEILETYINEVYLGQSGSRGIHGFSLASQHYFRQPLGELKLHQIALLVGLVKGASFYNPWNNPERATERRNLVLSLMRESDLISEEEFNIARQRKLDVVSSPNSSVYSYPSFIELVKHQLRADYDEDDLRNEGLRIFTTLSPMVQNAAEKSLTGTLVGLETNSSESKGSLQGAMVVTSVGNGEVLAVVGDRESKYSGFNRALDARRAIGSLVKPAVYLTALMQPEKFTLISHVDDSEFSVLLDGGDTWRPRNFSRQAHGEVPLYEALASSYNQATARLGVDVGVDKVAQTIQRLGVESDFAVLPSVLLGAVELSPYEVSSMYQTIASDGVYTPQRAILSVLDANGRPLNRYPLTPENRFDPEFMHLVQYALQATMQTGTGRTAYQYLDKEWLVAGKTGTTNEQRDSWFAGYSGDHLAVVWVGRDDNAPTSLTGATGAMRVWANLFSSVSSRPIYPLKPTNINYFWVDPIDGGLSDEGCEGAHYIPFVRGSEPRFKSKCRSRQNSVLQWLKNL
ncbi:penicillin-binding protein 1B [Aurantivibrio infirmus]